MLERTSKIWPSHPAISLGRTNWTDYATFANLSFAAANALHEECGLRTGDRVAVIMPNHPEYLVSLYAIWCAGLIAVPINAKLHSSEFEFILKHCGARMCITTKKMSACLQQSLQRIPDLQKILEVDAEPWLSYKTGNSLEVVEVSGDDAAWLFYTSGTTGKPKGAMLTHANLHSMTLGYFADVDTVSPMDCILHAAPLSHGSGMYNIPHIAKGANQVIPESGKFNPREILELIANYPGTTMFAAPTMVKRLVEFQETETADTENLKTIVYGGGPMYVEDLKKALRVFGNKLVQIYGQGESPMTITTLTKEMHRDALANNMEKRLASAGVPQMVVDVCMMDQNDAQAPAGECGEICARLAARLWVTQGRKNGNRAFQLRGTDAALLGRRQDRNRDCARKPPAAGFGIDDPAYGFGLSVRLRRGVLRGNAQENTTGTARSSQ